MSEPIARPPLPPFDAGTAVLAERGPGHVTAGLIADGAGVATGTFYNHFATVDAFIDAVAADLARGVEIGRNTLSEIEHDLRRFSAALAAEFFLLPLEHGLRTLRLGAADSLEDAS